MKRTLLFLFCALISTQMFSETLFGYLFPTLAYLERTSCHYMEGNEQNRTLNRLSFEDNMFEIDGNYYIEYNDMWLREDKEGRILVYSEPAKKDLVLYDFTLEIGDTLTTLNVDQVPMTEGDPILPGVKPVVVDYPIHLDEYVSFPIDTLIVTDVSMVMMCDSNQYKKWTFSNGMEYMEYIGNLGADFFAIIRNPWEELPTCCVEEDLVCASIYDGLVYLMDDEKRDLLNIDCPCTSWSNKWQWRTNTWNVLHFDGMAFEQTAQTWQYKLAHDTIIGGKEYTAVTRHWTAYDESAAEYVAAVRFTENKKAYVYYDNAEYLLYDFGYHEIGDTLEVFSGINNYEHFKTYKCVITDNYYTEGGIAEDTYVMDIIDPIIGNTIPAAMIWEEFVGSYSGFLHGGLLVPGSSNYQLLCAYKDNALAYSIDNDAFTDNDTFIEYGCEYNAEQSPEDLFPTLAGLQRTHTIEMYDHAPNDGKRSGGYPLPFASVKDTVINGKTYLQFGDHVNGSNYSLFFLREENNKVLIYSSILQNDLVLYDYTLELGDSLPAITSDHDYFSDDHFTKLDKAENIFTYVVTDVSTVTLLDGIERKKWILKNKYLPIIEYVEGIGCYGENTSHSGDFFRLIHDHPYTTEYVGDHLVCVSKNGQLLYSMPHEEMNSFTLTCECLSQEDTIDLKDLFPTLWGLQRTTCTKTIGEDEYGTVWGSRSYLMQEIQTTTIDGKQYIVFGDEYDRFALREENNKILVYSSILKKDLVLYDFTLEVGDSLPALYYELRAHNAMQQWLYNGDIVDYNKDDDGTILPAETFVVTDISTITLLDGKEYKKWTFDNGMEYVEGIGSFGTSYAWNDFYQLIANVPLSSDVHSQYLVCASRNNKLLYQMDDTEMERLGAECLCEYNDGPKKDNAKDGKIGGRPTPTQWNMLEMVVREMENNKTILLAETFSYTLEDNSRILNNKTYFDLARQSTRDTAITKSVVGALHFSEDEGNRVYFLCDGMEYLLYDFTAEPGDSIEIFSGINNYPQETTYTHVVTSKDTLENGACRMVLEVVFPNQTDGTNLQKVWLAGLGSLDGIVHNSAQQLSNARSAETESSVMLCAWREDDCLYTTDHPDFINVGCEYNHDYTAVEDVHTSGTQYKKIIRDGHLYIIHNGGIYNVLGINIAR